MNNIKFIFNQKVQEIDFENSEYTPNTTLLEYIRSQEKKKGTKEGCNEGDCGACTVVVIELIDNKLMFYAVNSCVFLLPAINRKQVITINELEQDTLHDIQQIFVEEHASQCGFCTPGFIMSAFAQKAENINSTAQDIIDAFAGNLCRCTGYQSIENSAIRIEKINNPDNFTKYACIDLLETIKQEQTINISNNSFNYILPFNFKEALEFKNKFPNYQLINGSTDIALKINKAKETIYNIIDLSDVREIQKIEINDNFFKIGAGLRIEQLYEFCRKEIPQIAEYLKVFGSKQIRNRATIGGSIATSSPIGDIMPILLALDSKIEIHSLDNQRIINSNDFIKGYRKNDLNETELIKSIIIPKPSKNQIIAAYKISKRTQLDISSVSACFSIKIDKNEIVESKLAYGGMAEVTKLATNSQNYIIGKNFVFETFENATKFIEKDFEPITDARSSAEARLIFAKNLLIKFFEDNSQRINQIF